MQHSLLYDWKHHLKPFVLGGANKLWRTKGHTLNQLMTTMFVGQPLALPGLTEKGLHVLLAPQQFLSALGSYVSVTEQEQEQQDCTDPFYQMISRYSHCPILLC